MSTQEERDEVKKAIEEFEAKGGEVEKFPPTPRIILQQSAYQVIMWGNESLIVPDSHRGSLRSYQGAPSRRAIRKKGKVRR